MERHRVLVIAYYFPPSGGPGVQRVLKYVRYLPEFGWEPVVLTVRDGEFPARDPSLLEEVPPSIHVERTRILEPYSLYRRLTRRQTPIDIHVLTTSRRNAKLSERLSEWIRATFFIPDARVGWLLTAVPAGKRLIRQFGIRALYSSSPPYTCSLIARQLKRWSGLPWIAGFRDPWTGFLTTPHRWWLPARIDRRLELSVFTEADLVECAWEGIAEDALQKYPHLPREKFTHIPNGFDPADYPPPPRERNSRFTITYTGSLYGRRNPKTLLQALELLFQRSVLSPKDVRLQIVGRCGEEVLDTLRQSPFSAAVELVSYVAHRESLQYVVSSDLLLLVVDEAEDSHRIVPGKVFEYLGSGKPILAIAPHNSAVERLLQETGTGAVADRHEAERCADIVERVYSAWKHSGPPAFTPRWDAIRKYERRTAAQRLAELLTTLTRTQPR
ncbi:MAG: glycosyltransferase [Candidatus Kapabacteria bacterium]|nr:glycosyltransferase [Candidatus Kapabacteria bacterium]MDW8012665.1 glycosyltransferase [Bacteroidota bacterium]